jgi:hypothetical protein
MRGIEMNMKLKLNKTSAVLIAVILAAVASLAFLIADVTALFIVAYVFTLIGIAAMLCGNLFLLNNARAYPWGAAFPQATLAYLVTSFVVSAAAVVLEQTVGIAIHAKWFVIAQVVILAAFAIRVIAMNAGRAEIERVNGKVRADTRGWRTLILDLEALAARCPEAKPLLEAVKYSDPVTSPELAECEAGILEGAAELKHAVAAGDDARVSQLCSKLLLSVKERNDRARSVK